MGAETWALWQRKSDASALRPLVRGPRARMGVRGNGLRPFLPLPRWLPAVFHYRIAEDYLLMQRAHSACLPLFREAANFPKASK
jgi:hypothetical protein